MARVQEHKDVGATKSTKDTKLKNTKRMSGHGFVNFVLLNFVLFVSFVAPDLRALDRERRE